MNGQVISLSIQAIKCGQLNERTEILRCATPVVCVKTNGKVISSSVTNYVCLEMVRIRLMKVRHKSVQHSIRPEYNIVKTGQLTHQTDSAPNTRTKPGRGWLQPDAGTCDLQDLNANTG